eukprot:EG_transcript_16166
MVAIVFLSASERTTLFSQTALGSTVVPSAVVANPHMWTLSQTERFHVAKGAATPIKEVGKGNLMSSSFAFWAATLTSFTTAFFLVFSRHRNVSLAAASGQKDEEIGLSRREALLGLSAAGALATSAPAYAFLGLGEDAGYPGDTQNIIAEIKSVLVLAADDPTKPDRITTLRRDMNSYVAKYRRDTRYGGRASFGNVYSVINAVAGHYNTFGVKTPIPKKRATQIVSEIGTAEQLLAKGR